MTYNEWRDELKNNLLSVSENERRRVLDYYAEAYADRREAGFSEHEIIEGFGAPYDAAQRILADRADYSDEFFDGRNERASECYCKPKEREGNARQAPPDRETNRETKDTCANDSDSSSDKTWIFVLLCIIFAVPLFGLLMGMVGTTIGLCVAPFAILVSGIGSIIGGIGSMIFGEFVTGLGAVGIGLIVLGVGIILMSLFTRLVKLIWKLWNSFFRWLRGLFKGRKKETAK